MGKDGKIFTYNLPTNGGVAAPAKAKRGIVMEDAAMEVAGGHRFRMPRGGATKRDLTSAKRDYFTWDEYAAEQHLKEMNALGAKQAEQVAGHPNGKHKRDSETSDAAELDIPTRESTHQLVRRESFWQKLGCFFGIALGEACETLEHK